MNVKKYLNYNPIFKIKVGLTFTSFELQFKWMHLKKNIAKIKAKELTFAFCITIINKGIKKGAN
ncbi:MAG: hypothetical protein ACI9Z4_000877 [Polaribacter sp.]|jgi:hypothetical protein